MTGQGWLAAYAHIASLLLPVACCASIGAFWARSGKSYPGEFVAHLATVVSTPALVFHTLVATKLDDARLLEVGAAALVGLAVAAAASSCALAVFKLPVRTLTAAATFPNAGNLGLPVAYLVFGEVGMAVAITFFAVNSVVQHTLGVWFTSRGGAHGQRWPKGVAIACVLALAARASAMPVPTPVLESARLIGSLAVPLMLLSLGYALATVSRSGLGRGAVLGAIRLLAGLLGGAAVVYLLGLPPLTAAVVALQLVMPVAVVSAIYVQRFSSEGDVAAGAVLVSTVVFLALCPLWIALVGSRNL